MAKARKDPARPEITRDTLEMLLDLVEIRIGCLEVCDRDDARELRTLTRARDEIALLLGRELPPLVPALIAASRRFRRPVAGAGAR
jgi:hypothetical protein